jgi:predicted nucleic acid-binding protein
VNVLRGLLDTSVFIAQESGRQLGSDHLPETSAVSVVTVAELTAGVLSASGPDTTSRRLATLDKVNQFLALPVDLAVAAEWARLRRHLADNQRRMGPNDLWIAATAAVHELPLFSQDADFDPLRGVRGLTVVRV